MKCNNCKKYEKCNDDSNEWCKICKICEKLSEYCKDCSQMYEDCKCYLEYIEVRKKHFISGYTIVKKRAMQKKYYISKLFDLFNFARKN